MAIYIAGADNIASGTALKTILAIATTTTNRAKIVEFGVSFQGVSAAAVPVEVRLQRQTSAGTGGAALATNYGPNALEAASPAPTVTALQGPSGTWTAEPTAGAVLFTQRVSPTSGLIIQYPLGQEPVMAVSSWLGLVVVAAATVQVSAYIKWDE